MYILSEVRRNESAGLISPPKPYVTVKLEVNFIPRARLVGLEMHPEAHCISSHRPPHLLSKSLSVREVLEL